MQQKNMKKIQSWILNRIKAWKRQHINIQIVMVGDLNQSSWSEVLKHGIPEDKSFLG